MTETNEQYRDRINSCGWDHRIKKLFLEIGQHHWTTVEAGETFEWLCHDIVFSENSVVMRDGHLYMIFVPEWELVIYAKKIDGFFEVDQEVTFEDFLKERG